MSIIIYLAIGIAAGLCSGVLGLGGGVVVVPALLFVFDHLLIDLASESIMHIAIGTSLMVMVLTSVASTHAHHRLSTVQWPIWRRWVPGLVFGASAGVIIATYLSTDYLKLLFGIFLLLVAVVMAADFYSTTSAFRLNRLAWCCTGFVIGVLSGLLGIGGGVLTVPFLNRYGLTMSRAAGTAAASTLPIALCGTVSSILAGWQTTLNVPHCYGFVYLPAVLIIAPATFVVAPLGAYLSRRLSSQLLRKCFAIFLILIVFNMVV